MGDALCDTTIIAERLATAPRTRRGDWIQVRGGGRAGAGAKFYPLDPDPLVICVEDIAHALAHACRFTGHTSSFYSVAEHSVRLSREVPPADALWGLLHDASEAYLVDLPRPLKHLPGFAAYREAEQLVMRAVCVRFGLPMEQPESVTLADRQMLRTEQRDLMPPPCEGEDRRDAQPYPERIDPWSHVRARVEFLDRFEELTKGGAT